MVLKWCKLFITDPPSEKSGKDYVFIKLLIFSHLIFCFSLLRRASESGRKSTFSWGLFREQKCDLKKAEGGWWCWDECLAEGRRENRGYMAVLGKERKSHMCLVIERHEKKTEAEKPLRALGRRGFEATRQFLCRSESKSFGCSVK